MTTSCRPSVLLAEDDEDARELLTALFRRNGYDVTPVSDGGRLLVCVAHAVALEDQKYDLMVFDICMPVCSGLQILESLRKARWTAPAILITGSREPGILAKVEALGGVLFEKPFQQDALLTVARTLVRHVV